MNVSEGEDARTEDVRLTTAVLLRDLLALVQSGQLDASTAHAVAMVRRIEGAIIALEAEVSDCH